MTAPSAEGASRPFCSEVSGRNAEPLAATASFVEHWLLVEYRGVWNPQAVEGSVLSRAVKEHLLAQLAALPRARLLFIRRPERRGTPGLACYAGVCRERDQRFVSFELEAHADLLALDFAALLAHGGGAALDHSLFLVCTHGKRDRCCARYGSPLYDELQSRASAVWQSTHVGGDRFAGNLVCLPEGLYFGRVGRADVPLILAEYRQARIHLDRFRGRSCYPFPVQAAERLVRARTDLRQIDDVRLVSQTREEGGWRIRLLATPSGVVHEVDVVSELGEEAFLTCDAPRRQRPRRFVAARHRIVPA